MNGNLDKKNGFLYAKAAVAALCGAFTAAFGWLGWLVLAWAACMALDWLSGSAAAASRGEWSSAAARAGIWHKAGMVVVVCVAALTDLVLNVAVENLPAFGDGVGFDFEGVVLPVVLVWYIFTELGSIAGMLVVVIVAALTDAVLSIAVANLPGLGITYQSLILPVVLVWYIFTELGSIAENAAHMGADVPDGLLKLLAAGKKAAERQTKDDEE